MILCCGEALIDMIPVATADGRAAWAPYAGGAVFNTAVALGRLDVPVGLLTGLSTDNFGQILRGTLTAARVDTTMSVATDRQTTLAFATLTEGHAEYSFYDEGSATRMLRTNEIPKLPDDVTTLFFGGISLASEPCATTLEDLQKREGANRITVLDPNVRPAFLADKEDYRARIKRMINRSDIVKFSDEDLMWLLPDERSLSAKMQAILDRGPAVVVTTLGSEGVIALCPGGVEISVSARPVQVIDTVGAGDTFNAGFLAHLSDHGGLTRERVAAVDPNEIEAALEQGIAAAAFVVSKAGAQSPHKHDLL